MSDESVEQQVRYEVTDQVGIITLRRPPVNALSQAVQDRIAELAAHVARDESVKAVVITAEGPGFSGGFDVLELSTMNGLQMMTRVGVTQQCFTAVARIPKPVAVAIDGYCLDGGLELALCGDRRICTRTARFGMPAVTMAVIPAAGGTQRLPRLVGVSAAKDMIFTGRTVEAREAMRIGLVDEVVDNPDDCLERAMLWAAQFTDLPIFSVRWSKEAIDTGLEDSLETGMLIESTGFTALFGTEDRRQRMRRFLEKE